ncbi:MAG: hypothetical protein ACFE0J_25845 [Elainellaceae cyanobacterium]
MRDFQDCETINDDLNIVISDSGSRNKRSKFRCYNPKRAAVKVIQVDDCAIKEGVRCDYLLVLPNGQEIYIELKGSDIKHAVAQIARAIELLACNCHPIIKLCFISSTRCPINSTEIQNLKKRFRQKYNAQITIKNGEITHICDSD